MRNPRLTKQRFERLHPASQLQAFCTHPENLVFNRNRPDGLSRIAQANLTNDWRAALYAFWEKLPNR